MTYKEFKAQGYTIEVAEQATVYSELIIKESGDYVLNKIETEVGEPVIFRIVSEFSDTEHDYLEFYDMDDVEDYIKNEM